MDRVFLLKLNAPSLRRKLQCSILLEHPELTITVKRATAVAIGGCFTSTAAKNRLGGGGRRSNKSRSVRDSFHRRPVTSIAIVLTSYTFGCSFLTTSKIIYSSFNILSGMDDNTPPVVLNIAPIFLEVYFSHVVRYTVKYRRAPPSPSGLLLGVDRRGGVGY